MNILNILVFDDSEANREAAKAQLKGHRLTVVETYQAAQELLVSGDVFFDVVLSDLLVPASGQSQGPNGQSFVGQEMPVGIFIGLLAAVRACVNMLLSSPIVITTHIPPLHALMLLTTTARASLRPSLSRVARSFSPTRGVGSENSTRRTFRGNWSMKSSKPGPTRFVPRTGLLCSTTSLPNRPFPANSTRHVLGPLACFLFRNLNY